MESSRAAPSFSRNSQEMSAFADELQPFGPQRRGRPVRHRAQGPFARDRSVLGRSDVPARAGGRRGAARKNPEAAVVVAFADEPPPEVYQSLVDSPRNAHAIAVRLEARKATPPVDLSWSDADGDDAPEEAVWRFARSLNEGTNGSWSANGQRWTWTLQ
jgi:hypothetical protein